MNKIFRKIKQKVICDRLLISCPWYGWSLRAGFIGVALLWIPSTFLSLLEILDDNSSSKVSNVLFTIPNVWFALDIAAETCLWNFSSSSTITPRS